jgi:branched-chain amino acid transport system permease protein
LDTTILLFILQDGTVTGAIYALLGIALVMVFAVSRVIFVPQGEFVAFGAITIAALADGKVPGTVWLTLVLGIAAFVADLIADRRMLTPSWFSRRIALDIALPLALLLAAFQLAPLHLNVVGEVALTLALTIPNGPYLYRVAFRPLASAPVLVLFIAAIAVHLALTGLGLVVFGPEGYKTDPLWDASFDLGPVPVSGQNILVVSGTLILMAALWVFFEVSRQGKALRAVAVNRVGARLVGVPTERAGQIAFALAAALGTVAGILVISTTTVFYDTGFIIGLKGFVAAIIGGMSAYPPTVLAAIAVGIIESFSSFWASAFKEVIVFSLIIPVLLWRSLRAPQHDEEG